MKRPLRLALFPVPQVEKRDTSLRYTDILFGFVIRELFLRLQRWDLLDAAVRWHLAVGTALVLGSWIGYRRSLNRSSYQVKFFNLPLWKFAADQLMLILYFRLAVLTSVDVTAADPMMLARGTAWLILLVFILYLVWDALGVWMAFARGESGTDGTPAPRYPLVENDVMTSRPERVDWVGRGITFGGLLWMIRLNTAALPPERIFVETLVVLLVYRWAKDFRTSWQLSPKP